MANSPQPRDALTHYVEYDDVQGIAQDIFGSAVVVKTSQGHGGALNDVLQSVQRDVVTGLWRSLAKAPIGRQVEQTVVLRKGVQELPAQIRIQCGVEQAGYREHRQ
jgi:hypothetical protein